MIRKIIFLSFAILSTGCATVGVTGRAPASHSIDLECLDNCKEKKTICLSSVTYTPEKMKCRKNARLCRNECI